MHPWVQVWKTAFICTGNCIKLKRELELLTLKNCNSKLSRNVGNYQYTVRNIPEEQRSNLNRGESKNHAGQESRTLVLDMAKTLDTAKL